MFTMKLLKTMFTWKNMIAQILICQMLVAILVAHTSSLKFKFTNHTFNYKLVISTTNFHFLTLIMSIADMDNTTRDNIRDNLLNITKVTIMKFLGKLCLQFFVTFFCVYALTTFADNLLVALLGLSETIVFTIYIAWCTILVTYPLVLSYLVVVLQYTCYIKKRDIHVEATMLFKVSIGYSVNSILMSPLINKVGDELRPKWGGMMRGMVLLGFVTPIFAICMFHMLLVIKELINSLGHIMKKPLKQE